MNKYKVIKKTYNPFRMMEEKFEDIIEASFYEVDDKGNVTFVVESENNDYEGMFIKYQTIATYHSGSWDKVEMVKE